MKQTHDLYEWPEEGIRAAIDFIFSNGVKEVSIIDVGGHQGETLAALDKNVERFKYEVFEPNPSIYGKLKKFSKTIESEQKKINIINAAVGAEDGEIEFFITQATEVAGVLKPVDGLSERVPTGDHQIANSIQSQLCKLDSINAVKSGEKIDLLKIDTEGFDLEVMKGASKALKSGQFNVVLSEAFFVPYRQEQAFFWDLAQFMQSCGYHFVNLYDCRNTGQGRLYTGNALWLSPSMAAMFDFL